MTTDPQRLARLEGAYEHLATKADLKDLELRLTGRDRRTDQGHGSPDPLAGRSGSGRGRGRRRRGDCR